MADRPIQRLFAEYAESHRNPVNLAVHWIAVPLIYFSIIGLLQDLSGHYLPPPIGAMLMLVLLLVVLVYYLRHSWALGLGMGVFTWSCLWVARLLDAHAGWPLWAISAGLFALAWVAQFIGHGVEGRKPSFLKDLQFLLIGPAWLLAKLFRKAGIAY